MYNQPTMPMPSGRMVGSLYKNPFDCLWKTIATEGPLALYKGTYTSWGIDSPFFFYRVFLQVRPPTFYDRRHIRELFSQYYGRYLNVCRRIITLTANDVIIGLYKRLRRGTIAWTILHVPTQNGANGPGSGRVSGRAKYYPRSQLHPSRLQA